MGVSRLTILGFAILAWSGVAALLTVPLDATRFETPLVIASLLGATGGLATAIVGAARHDEL